MGKKYISKRLQNQNLRLEHYKNTNSIDNTVQTSTEHLTTTTEKKLKLSRAQLRARSTSTTQSTIEDEDEPPFVDDESASHDIPFNSVNIIVSIGMILNLVNKLSCPVCNRVGKMSSKSYSTSRSPVPYHVFMYLFI